MKRHEALRIVLASLKKSDLAITTTGLISREAFAVGERKNNFYMVGSMGLVSPVALGVACNVSRRRVIAIEGDGSLLMNLGILAMIGAEKPANLVSIILDNESYESTGGQPSVAAKVDLAKFARVAGYQQVIKTRQQGGLVKAMQKVGSSRGPSLVLVKVDRDRLADAPRVSYRPTKIRDRFRGGLGE